MFILSLSQQSFKNKKIRYFLFVRLSIFGNKELLSFIIISVTTYIETCQNTDNFVFIILYNNKDASHSILFNTFKYLSKCTVLS